MKRNIVLIITIFLFTKAYAQHEAKANVYGIALNTLSVSYEGIINSRNGVNIGFWYQYIPLNFKHPIEFLSVNYTSKGAFLEYRFYVRKKAHPAVGFWFGSYTKYTKQSFKDIALFKIINHIFQNDDSISRVDVKKIGIGIATGYKWIYKDKVIFGLYAGIGGYIYAVNSLVDNNGDALGYEDAGDLKKKAQFRFGFNVGYRFGHSKVENDSH